MTPEVSRMVPGVSGMVSGIYGRFGRTGRLWKVSEGSGAILGSLEGSIIGATTLSHISLKGRETFLKCNSDSQNEAVFW